MSLLDDKTNAQGMRQYVVAYGNARITEGGAVRIFTKKPTGDGSGYLEAGLEYCSERGLDLWRWPAWALKSPNQPAVLTTTITGGPSELSSPMLRSKDSGQPYLVA